MHKHTLQIMLLANIAMSVYVLRSMNTPLTTRYA